MTQEKKTTLRVHRELSLEEYEQYGEKQIDRKSLEEEIRDRVEEHNDTVDILNTKIKSFLSNEETDDKHFFEEDWIMEGEKKETDYQGVPKIQPKVEISKKWKLDDEMMDMFSSEINLDTYYVDVYNGMGDTIDDFEYDVSDGDYDDEIMGKVFSMIYFGIKRLINQNEQIDINIKKYEDGDFSSQLYKEYPTLEYYKDKLPNKEIVTSNHLETMKILDGIMYSVKRGTFHDIYSLERECK